MATGSIAAAQPPLQSSAFTYKERSYHSTHLTSYHLILADLISSELIRRYDTTGRHLHRSTAGVLSWLDYSSSRPTRFLRSTDTCMPIEQQVDRFCRFCTSRSLPVFIFTAAYLSGSDALSPQQQGGGACLHVSNTQTHTERPG